MVTDSLLFKACLRRTLCSYAASFTWSHFCGSREAYLWPPLLEEKHAVWPSAIFHLAGEFEDSVISFLQLLLRNLRPATGLRT